MLINTANKEKGFFWLVAGNVLYGLYQWLLIALIIKAWGSEYVGYFAYGLAISAPVFMFSNLNLRTVLAIDVNEDYDFGSYFGLRLIMSLIAGMSVYLFCLTAGIRNEELLIISFVVALKLVESFSDISFGALQQQRHLKDIGSSMAIKSIGSSVIVFSLFSMHSPVWFVLLMVMVFWILVLVLFDLKNVIKTKYELANINKTYKDLFAFLLSGKNRISLVKHTASLGFVSMLISLDANIPRYIVKRLHGVDELGIYAGIGFIIILGNNVVISYCQSIVSKLARHREDNQKNEYFATIFKTIKLILVLCIVGAIAAKSFGGSILNLVYSHEYAEQSNLFALLVLGAGFGYSALVFHYAGMASRRFLIQVVVFSSSIAVTFVLSILFSRQWGVNGIAAARAVGYLIQLIILLFIITDKRSWNYIDKTKK
jgi:O-antigen/teichoic acid export membrane protein